jgi:hypothetical protein
MATPPISREGYRQAILPLFQKKIKNHGLAEIRTQDLRRVKATS